MNWMNHLVCPISQEKIDSNISRLSVFTLVVLMAFFLVTSNPAWLYFVVLDYFLRAIGYGQYSLLTLCYTWVNQLLGIPPKYIDKAQKVFAARLGWLCSALALVLSLAGFTTAALVVIVLLATLSTMDSVFNFCVGCLIYNYLVLPFYS